MSYYTILKRMRDEEFLNEVESTDSILIAMRIAADCLNDLNIVDCEIRVDNGELLRPYVSLKGLIKG